MSTESSGSAPVIQQDWLEARSDLLNPILVKETRQALKSQAFVSVFILMLVVSWLITAIGVLYVHGPELQYAAAGRQFFSAFYAVLAIAIFLVVPQGAFRSIQVERDLQTYEMLTITKLSPRHVVWGKWWSAVVQTSVFYAAIAPFMLFTNLLRGISLAVIAFFLAWSFLGSAVLSMVAIAFSTFTKQRQVFGVLQIVLIMPLVGSLMVVLQLLASVLQNELPFDRVEFWLVQAIILTFLIPAFVLFRQVATANLMFEGSNRSTGIRSTCLILECVAIFWVLLFSFGSSLLPATMVYAALPTEYVIVYSTTFSIWLWMVGLFAVTEDDRLSRRVRKDSPTQTWVRCLVLPFYPGGHRGFLYVIVSMGLAIGTLFMANSVSSGTAEEKYESQLLLVVEISYLLFYLGLTSYLGRMIRKLGNEIHATHARVLGVLMGAIGILAPLLLVFWDTQLLSEYPIVLLSNPFAIGFLYVDNPDRAPHIMYVILLGFIGLGLNLASIKRGIIEFLTADPTPNAVAHVN